MSFFDTPFTPDAAKAKATFDPIPDATYVLVITKCVEKLSKNNDPMLSMQYEVDAAHEQHAGRKIFGIIMLDHPKAEVKASGQRQLHALCLMCGLEKVECPSDFEGRTITARVKISVDKSSGEKRNEVVLVPPKAGAPKVETPAEQSPW